MKIRVISEEENISTIDVVGPIKIFEGENLDSVHCADGRDYFFDKTGNYAGSGAIVVDCNEKK